MARPRLFDSDTVLDRSMDVFWRYGFDGASLSELKNAMGINGPSLYATFGSKMGLFAAVIERYKARRDKYRIAMLAEKTGKDAASRFLNDAVEWLTAEGEPLGCLLVQAGLSTSRDNDEVPRLLAAQRGSAEILLRNRFEQAKLDGDLPESADVKALAGAINNTFLGLCVQAAAGVPASELRKIVSYSLQAWPVGE